MRKVAQLLALTALVAVLCVPAAVQADSDRGPRQLDSSSCITAEIGGKSFVLFRHHVSCSYAKRWARKVAATRGRSKPRGWQCTSGNKFRSIGYCQRGSKHFGWER